MEGGEEARRWTWEKKKRAMETLLVEWVEGKPYSRWWEPIAVRRRDVSTSYRTDVNQKT
jgi:hypothetical protein